MINIINYLFPILILVNITFYGQDQFSIENPDNGEILNEAGNFHFQWNTPGLESGTRVEFRIIVSAIIPEYINDPEETIELGYNPIYYYDSASWPSDISEWPSDWDDLPLWGIDWPWVELEHSTTLGIWYLRLWQLTGMDPLECGYDYAWRMDGREAIGGQDAWGWPDPVQSEVRTFNWGNHEFNECSIINEEIIPEDFSINNIYPNPFDMVTNITYELPNHANVRLVVYNLLGREIETLTDGIQARGNHSVNWNASSYAAGVYFIRMDSGDPFKNWTWISQNKQNICLSRECTSFDQTRKVVLVK